jgi:hypothetical protein
VVVETRFGVSEIPSALGGWRFYAIVTAFGKGWGSAQTLTELGVASGFLRPFVICESTSSTRAFLVAVGVVAALTLAGAVASQRACMWTDSRAAASVRR